MSKVPRAILLVILTLMLLLAGCSAGCEPSVARVGEPAPDFQLQNLDGQAFSLRDLRGKPVLFNFWTTWCSPCVFEMPYLQQIYEEWSGKPTPVVVLGINVGESASTAKSFMQRYNLSFPVLLDTRQIVAQKYNIIGYPTTFLIDKNGIIQGVKIGPFQSKEEIEGGIRRVIP